MFCIGAFWFKTEWFGETIIIPVILIAVAAGIFGHNLETAIHIKAIRRNPKEARRIEIEQKDERNVMINNSAKSKAYDAMSYIQGTAILICALLGIDSL